MALIQGDAMHVESPSSHICEALTYLYLLEDHLRALGRRTPSVAQALELVAGAKGRCWRAVEILRAEREAGQGAPPIPPWWYRVRRFARRSGVVGTVAWALALFACIPTACESPSGPGVSFVPAGAVAFTPTAADSGAWVAMEGCSHITAPFARLSWYYVPGGGFTCPEGSCDGWWERPHTIYLAHQRMTDSRLVAHELLHDLLQRGDHPAVFQSCGVL